MRNKVAVVLSSADKITLKDGIEHDTGFFLPEVVVPARMVIKADFELVYVNPEGSKPYIDKVSDVYWFDEPNKINAPWYTSEEEYKAIREFGVEQGLCNPDPNIREGTKKLKEIAHVTRELEEYVGVLIPGGHAPMKDLYNNPALGYILQEFHKSKLPTGAICHGPIGLLSALPSPEDYIEALKKDDRQAIARLSKDWIYRDYDMTSFTTREEMQEEPEGTDHVLGGYVQFYLDEALEKADAHVLRGKKWESNVVVHNELITGQNPFSDEAFGKAFVNALNEVRKAKKKRAL